MSMQTWPSFRFWPAGTMIISMLHPVSPQPPPATSSSHDGAGSGHTGASNVHEDEGGGVDLKDVMFSGPSVWGKA